MGKIILPERKRLLTRRGLLLAAPAIILTRPAFGKVDFAPHLPEFWEFTGGPIATLGSVTGGSGYTASGTYTKVPLTGSISGAIDAQATIVVSGGAVTSATLTFGGGVIGGIAGNIGATGYYTIETVTCANTFLGGAGSGWSVPVATVSGYSFQCPPGIYGFLVDTCGGGAGGGGGQTTSGAGGGGGGSGANLQGFPLAVLSGAILTITPGQPGAGGAINTNGTSGTTSNITGAKDYFQNINPGLFGAFGGSVTTQVGGVGGAGGAQGNGNGGAAATVGGSPVASSNPYYFGGSGGGGGGSVASAGGAGSRRA